MPSTGHSACYTVGAVNGTQWVQCTVDSGRSALSKEGAVHGAQCAVRKIGTQGVQCTQQVH